MRVSKRLAQAILIGRHSDKVDMIGHEAVAPDFRLGIERGFAEQVDVQRVVAFLKEDATSSVTSLRHVVRVTGNNKSW
jgi:hypothetical protein